MKKLMVLLTLCAGSWCSAQLRQNCDHFVEQIDQGEATPGTFFQAATCLASNNQKEEAFTYLEMAVGNGFRDVARLKNHHNLKGLQSDPRWAQLLSQLEKQAEEHASQKNPELARIYAAHRSAHKDGRLTDTGDGQRLLQLEKLLAGTSLKLAEDLYHAAIIYLHGSTAEHFDKAVKLARAAHQKDPTLKTNPLLCKAEDRKLLATGQPQVWGTHRHKMGDEWTVEPFDHKAKTDDQRRKMGVPVLEDIRRDIKRLNARAR